MLVVFLFYSSSSLNIHAFFAVSYVDFCMRNIFPDRLLATFSC